jgi:hypothetical protein
VRSVFDQIRIEFDAGKDLRYGVVEALHPGGNAAAGVDNHTSSAGLAVG